MLKVQTSSNFKRCSPLSHVFLVRISHIIIRRRKKKKMAVIISPYLILCDYHCCQNVACCYHMLQASRITYVCSKCAERWLDSEWKHHFIYPKNQLLLQSEKGTHKISCELGTNCENPAIDFVHYLYTKKSREPKTYYYCLTHAPIEKSKSHPQKNDERKSESYENKKSSNPREKKRQKISSLDYVEPVPVK
jgi:hypothetical protein